MNEIFGYLKSPGWWFSSVIVAIILSYAKPTIDIFIARYSHKRRKALELQNSKNRELVERLRNDRHEQLIYGGMITKMQTTSIVYFASGIVMFIMLNILLTIFVAKYGAKSVESFVSHRPLILLFTIVGSLMFFRAFQVWFMSMRKGEILNRSLPPELVKRF